MRMISNHGQEKRYFHTSIGINGRIDTLQAAILLAKLEFYPDEIKKRRSIGEYYSKKLQEIGINSTPKIKKESTSVYAQFTIQVTSRDKFQEKLKAQGIPTAIHYPKILPMQPVFKSLDSKELEKKYSKQTIHRIKKDGCEIVKSLQISGITNISFPIFDYSGYAIAALTAPFLNRLHGNKVNINKASSIMAKYSIKLSNELGYESKNN